MNFSPARRWLTLSLEGLLADKLQTELKIGDVEIGLFNRVTLRNVHLKDLHEEELLSAGLLSAKIELAPLFSGEISLRTVSILDAHVNLYKAKETENTNFQFIIDAFKSDKEKNNNLNLKINSIIFRRCNVSYVERYKPSTPERLNLSHLNIDGLDANISLKRLTPDSLNLRIRSLKFKEQSGLDVRGLTLRMMANKEKCDISHFQLDLPNSRVVEKSLHATYHLDSRQNLLSSVRLKGALNDALIATDDISCLVPMLDDIHQEFVVSTDFKVSPKSIELMEVKAHEKNKCIELTADLSLEKESDRIASGEANIRTLNVDSVSLTKYLDAFLSSKQLDFLKNLGDLSFDAKANYVRDKWSTFSGNLYSQVGEVRSSLKWKGKSVAGNIGVSNLRLQNLLSREDVPETVSLSVAGETNFITTENPLIKVGLSIEDGLYRGKSYKGISVETNLLDHRLNAVLKSEEENALFNVELNAILKGKSMTDVLLESSIEHLNLNALNLTDYFGNHSISCKVNVKAKSLDLHSPQMAVSVKDFNIIGEDPYLLKNFLLTSRPSRRGTLVKMNSDFGSFMVDGPLSLEKLKASMGNLVGSKIPGMTTIDVSANDYRWMFDIKLRENDFYSKVLHLPLNFDGNLSAEGYLSANGDRVFASAVANNLKYNSTEISNLRFLLRDKDKELLSRIQLNKKFGNENMHFELENVTQNGRLLTGLIWGDSCRGRYNGVLKTETTFDSKKTISTKILPTELTINDTVWNVLPGEVAVFSDSVSIKRIAVEHADQGLDLYGRLSSHPKDSIVMDLKKMDVEYILSMVNLGSFSFSGLASGRVSLANTMDSMQMHTRLNIPDFCFNSGKMGNADIKGSWNKVDQRINLWADILEDSVGFTKVRGYVSPADKNLDLRIESKNTNVFFLNRYLSGILDDVEGRTSGMCRVYGPFKGIDFEGREHVSMSTLIGATGVKYNLSGGDVVMSPGKFGFENFDVFDGEVGGGKLNGHLLHNHLKKIRYKIDVKTDDLLVYDKGPSLDMPFYATVYGTGRMVLSGKPGLLEANLNLRPEKKTSFVYTVDTPESTGDIQMLSFADVADSIQVANDAEEVVVETPQENANPLDIRLNFLISMNPEASLKVIMDRRTGDHLLLNCYGPISASFYNKGSFEMFGKLNVDRGIYKMSIQDIIRKDFEFTRGSYINFSGNPFNADLGLKATYTVNSASLSDLNIGNSLSENSVRVNCILNFTGKVKAPQVSFDLELPTVSEEVQHMVRNLISTEEDMNMQVLYLLGVGRFYTYNYSTTENAESQRQSSLAMKSFLSNTLSSQLNNIISNAVGASNWSFGANLSTGSIGWSDMEVAGILSGRLLNNRLLINGNFGYRDRSAYSTSNTNFVGDFDVRYLLTPGGGVSLKAYSETNDRYFSKSSLSTQGLGILLKRDFSNLRDLFIPKKKKNKK